MTIRYAFHARPEQADALRRVMGEIGVEFDPQENLCALIDDNILEGIFMGNDLDWLPLRANEHLEDRGSRHRFRTDLDQLDDLQAQYGFLTLMTLHSDWDRPGGSIREISPREMEEFRVKHPLAMHPAGEKPEQLPAPEPRPVDLNAPIHQQPVLGDILRVALLLVEQEMSEGTDLRRRDLRRRDPRRREEGYPATDMAAALESAPQLRHILSGIHRDFTPRQHMGDQFGGQIYSTALRVLELMDVQDRDRLDELARRSLQAMQGKNGEESDSKR